MTLTFDMVMWCTSGALGLAVIVLLPWSLRGDRARGRRRCPRCWYSMEGVPTLVCPECGRDARREKRLLRTRRRWRWATLALLLAPVAASLAITPTVREKGWRQSIPGGVLVTLWPISLDEWMSEQFDHEPSQDPMLRELDSRVECGDLGPWASHRWADRLSRHVHRHTSDGAQDVDRLVQKLRDARITRSFRSAMLRDVLATLEQDVGVPLPAAWNTLREEDVGPDTWVSVDLVNASFFDALDRIHFAINDRAWWPLPCSFECGATTVAIGCRGPTPTRTFVWPIGELIDSYDAADARLCSRSPRLESQCCQGCSYSCFPSHESQYPEVRSRRYHADDVIRLLEAFVDPEHWIDGGGEFGTAYFIGDRLFVRTLPQNRHEIDDLLNAMTRALDPTAHAELIVDLDPQEYDAASAVMETLEHSFICIPDTPLSTRQLAGMIQNSTGVPIDLDWSGLRTLGLCDEVVLSGPGAITALEAMERITAALSRYSEEDSITAGWTVWRGAVRLYSEDGPRRCTTIRVYNVEDLILRPGESDPENPLTCAERLDDIRRQITSTIEPDTWLDDGGEIGMLLDLGPCLIIQTTHKQHAEITELLASLRVKQDGVWRAAAP